MQRLQNWEVTTNGVGAFGRIKAITMSRLSLQAVADIDRLLRTSGRSNCRRPCSHVSNLVSNFVTNDGFQGLGAGEIRLKKYLDTAEYGIKHVYCF